MEKDLRASHPPRPPQSLSRDGSVTKPTVEIDLFQFSTDFLFRHCFLCAWHNAVLFSLQSFLCSSSTLRCLLAWQLQLHILVSDSAYPHHVCYHFALWDNHSIGQL